ncbi:hypothetical protein [Polycladidibacter stylochi]|uniref:hypothetical protein n=1 Tax=Polycladidibacter stylochi TaxID=1807766 RepID=UPI0008348D11|nr:hypothetical protein [Pseudovibrio stylochi]
MNQTSPIEIEETTATSYDSKRDVAEYCQKICGELSVLARNNQLPFLSYLLEMAEKEARENAQGREQQVIFSS